MDFSKLSPTEFEDLVAKTFRRLGFRTAMTQKTGDGGVDVEARYDGEIFKGTYLIQCKHWKKNIGEPPLRDLYGVVQDRNALKGIIVSSSGFSKKAKEFAEGKNLDLIDGDTLQKLSSVNDIQELTQQPVYAEEVRGFTEHPQFDKSLYDTLTKMINDNPKIEDTYKSLLDLLLNSIWEMEYEALENGCLQEAIYYSQKYLERFAMQKNNAARAKRIGIEYTLMMLHFIKGDYIQTYQYLCSLEDGHNFKPHSDLPDRGLERHPEEEIIDIYLSLLNILGVKTIGINKYLNKNGLLFPTSFIQRNAIPQHKPIHIKGFRVEVDKLKNTFKMDLIDNIEEQRNIIQNIYSRNLYKLGKVLEAKRPIFSVKKVEETEDDEVEYKLLLHNQGEGEARFLNVWLYYYYQTEDDHSEEEWQRIEELPDLMSAGQTFTIPVRLLKKGVTFPHEIEIRWNDDLNHGLNQEEVRYTIKD